MEFEEPDDAKEAMENMSDSEMHGRVLKVNPSTCPVTQRSRYAAVICIFRRSLSLTFLCFRSPRPGERGQTQRHQEPGGLG